MTSSVVSLENKSSTSWLTLMIIFFKNLQSNVVSPICNVIVGISSLTIRNITSCTNQVRTSPTRNFIGTFIVGMVVNQDLGFRQIKDMSIIIAIIINKLFLKVTKFDDPKLTWKYVHTHYKMGDVLRWMYLCNQLQLLKIIKERS